MIALLLQQGEGECTKPRAVQVKAIVMVCTLILHLSVGLLLLPFLALLDRMRPRHT